MQFEENVLLADFTTFHIGGPARYFVRVDNIDDVKEALAFAKEKNLKMLVLGGGSNVLISDGGFDGLVIKIELRGVEIQKNETGALLVAAAGESWDEVVARAVQENMWGVENLSGIPGTVGGAPVQNIGAYGCELRDTLAWVEVLDTQTGEVERLDVKDCGFGYRTSRFKREGGRYVVLKIALTLAQDGKPNDSYKDLADIAGLTLAEIRQKVLAVRAGKFPDLSREGTAGSFFLNPVLPAATAGKVLVQYPACPHFDAEGGIKLSLAWLLDKALEIKGMSEGGARLFERQPLVIVASRGAHADDVVVLANKIKKNIKEKIGIDIEEEVRIIG